MFQFKSIDGLPMDYMGQCYNLFSTFSSLNISPLEDQICFDILSYELEVRKRNIKQLGYYFENKYGEPLIVINPKRVFNLWEEIFVLSHELIHFRDDIYNLKRTEGEIDLSAYAT